MKGFALCGCGWWIKRLKRKKETLKERNLICVCSDKKPWIDVNSLLKCLLLIASHSSYIYFGFAAADISLLFWIMSTLQTKRSFWSPISLMGSFFLQVVCLNKKCFSINWSEELIRELLNSRLKEKYRWSKLSVLYMSVVHCVLPLAGGSSMTLLSCRDQGHAMLSWEEIYTSAMWIKTEMLAFISAWHQTPLAPLSAEKPVFILHVSLASLHQSWSFLYAKGACCK